MALEMNDLMALRSLESGMSPFEQVKVANMQTRSHTSGVGVAGLVLGCVGTAAGIGAWIFAPLYANAKANQAKEAANANQRQLDQLTALLAAERNERISGDVTLNQTITDTVSGSQQGSLTAQQQADLNAVQSVQQTLFDKAIMGGLSENPTKVQIYSAPQPCPCPGCGCGN